MAIAREAWLAQTIEEPLEPLLPICDTHHHLWDRPDMKYYVDEYLRDVAGNNVVRTVAVECESMYRPGGPPAMRPVGETEFIVTELTRNREAGTAVGAGIVAYADLTLGGGVVPVLEAHLEAGKGRLRGIRNMATWDASPELPRMTQNAHLLMEPSFREGFSYLRRYGLSFDAWVYHTQLDDVADLARAFPDVTIVLDHAGTPIGVGPYAGRREEVFREWQRGMAVLADCQNVSVKVSGLGQLQCGFGFHERAVPIGSAELAGVLSPYFTWCIEKFGPNRCLFESNFPPDKRGVSYTVLCNAFKRLTAGFPESERMALFHGTAARVYRLPPPERP